MKRITALVPMKGHSERVPGKNLRDFNGKPLFYWILHELTKVSAVKDIFVDTDNPKLAEMILTYFSDSVKIIDRPQRLHGDDISMNEIISYDISIISNEHFLQTHTTNPLLTASTIERAIEVYFSSFSDNDSIFSVSAIQNRCYTHENIGINHNPDELLPTQQLKPVFVENSNLYIFSKESFKKKQRRIGVKPLMFEMSQYEAIDIDEEEDFIYSEILHKARC